MQNEGETKEAKWSKKFKSLTYWQDNSSTTSVNCETKEKAKIIIGKSKVEQTLRVVESLAEKLNGVCENLNAVGEIPKEIELDAPPIPPVVESVKTELAAVQKKMDHLHAEMAKADKAGDKFKYQELKDEVGELVDKKAELKNKLHTGKNEDHFLPFESMKLADRLKFVCEDASESLSDKTVKFPSDDELADDEQEGDTDFMDDEPEKEDDIEEGGQEYMVHRDRIKSNQAAISKLHAQSTALFNKAQSLKPEQQDKRQELNKKRFAINNTIADYEKDSAERRKKIKAVSGKKGK